MSKYDNRWAGSTYRPIYFGGFSLFPPVIKALLISNVAVWGLLGFFLAPFRVSDVPLSYFFTDYLALWPLGPHFYPWQLVTYMFMHGGFWHLFFNMLALWMFGVELERLWGSKQFLTYYLICGIGGGIANLIVSSLLGQGAPTIGASGAVFGVLLAFGVMFPNQPIYLYFLVPIRAKFFIAFYIGLELFYGVTGTTDGVAHFAHLGGAATGYLLLLIERNVLPVRRWLEDLSGGSRETLTGNRRFSRPHTGIHEATFTDIRPEEPADGESEITQELIDGILDKIGKDGYQGLTEREKQILNEASRKIH